ncbi:MAG: hypothetical protein J6D21_09550 [Clostridia bacterium]|nr:hypothetical protein [Clostridia bacterium]
MLKILLRNQLRSVFARKPSEKTGKLRPIASRVAVVILLLVLAAVFLGMFGGLFYVLAVPLMESGLGWFYFALAVLLALIVSLFCTVFYAQPQIYGAKDNDLLLAMPIKPSDILTSRLLVLYFETLVTAALVMLPAGVVWCIDCPVTVLGTVFFVLGTLLVSAFSMAIALVVGAILAWVRTHFKWKNLLSAIGFVVFFVLYFWGIDRMEVFIDRILTDPTAYAESVKGTLYPAYAFGAAVAEHNVALFGIYALVALAPTALVVWVLNRTFIRLVTTKRGESRIKYRRRTMKASSPLWAFTKKELRHMTSNVTYLINAAIGVVFMPVLSVMLLVAWPEMEYVLALIPDANAYVSVFLPVIPCFLASTVFLSAATVSIEGKNLWIAQCSPCAPGDILMAKALSHILPTAPSALIASLLLLPIAPDAFAAVSLVVIPQLFVALTAMLGVTLNLMLPKLDYENDVAAVKRGTPTLLLMLAGMLLCIAPIVAVFKIAVSAYVILSVYTGLLLVLNLVLYRYLRTAGGRRFMSL